MESKPTTRNRGFASWIDDFIGNWATKHNSQEKTAAAIVESDINIHNLDKVVWNDDTYYVKFDQNGATVYNEFANEVTKLKGAHTIQDVDKALNSQQVVASDDAFTETLAKALGLHKEAGEFDPEGTTPGPNGDAESDVAPDPLDSSNADGPQIGNPTPTTTTSEEQQNTLEENSNSGESSSTSNTVAANEDAKTVGEMIDSVKGEPTEAATLEDDSEGEGDYIFSALQDIQQKLADLSNLAPVPQEYARHDLSEVGYPTQPMENDHFEPEAKESAEEIKREDSTDLTTPEGRTDVFKRLVPSETGYASQVYNDEAQNAEPAVVPGVNEDHNPVDNNTADISAPNVDSADSDHDNEKVLPGGDDAQTLQEEDDERGEAAEENAKPDDSANDNNHETGKADKPEVAARLASRDANVFKNAVCPSCGVKKLTLSNVKVASFQGVYCGSCEVEYAVDINTEEIFKKN